MTEIKTWLGYAEGESDLPCASFLRSREAVQRFLVEFWHGESGSETEDAMRDFDDHDFSLGALKWHFNIGGVSIERVAEIDELRAALATAEREPVQPTAKPDDWAKRIYVGTAFEQYVFSATQYGDFQTPLYTNTSQPVEPVAWQYRAFDTDNGWGMWHTASKSQCDFAEKRGCQARALYTHPPVQPALPPHECKTDAEKTAYAFGWWKALESKND